MKMIATLALAALIAGCGGSDEPIPDQTIGKPDCSKPEACK